MLAVEMPEAAVVAALVKVWASAAEPSASVVDPASIRVLPERSWEQKRADIVEHGVDVFVMGDDWAGKFDELSDVCEVRYLPRTSGVSSTEIKEMLRTLDPTHIEEMQAALGTLTRLLEHYRDLT